MLPLWTLVWHTLSVLIACLPYEIEFLYPRRPLEIEFRRHRYHRELQQPNLFTSIDRTARLSAQECRRYIIQDPLPPLRFFLHPSYTFFSHTQNPKTTNTHNNPRQNTTYADNTTTLNQSCMYTLHSSTSFFCLFVVVFVAASIEVVVARSQVKLISTAVIDTTTQWTCIATLGAVAQVIAKAIAIQFSDQKSRWPCRRYCIAWWQSCDDATSHKNAHSTREAEIEPHPRFAVLLFSHK